MNKTLLSALALGSALVLTPESAMAEHRTTLDDAVSWVMERYPTLDLKTELVRDSQSAALLRYGPRSSMLVMGTHHRGVLAGSLLGSVVHLVLGVEAGVRVLRGVVHSVVVVPEGSRGLEVRVPVVLVPPGPGDVAGVAVELRK